MPGADIAIVVPVLNEAENIAPLVIELHRHLGNYDWEIVFVDDDSRDGTLETLRQIGRDDMRVRFIRRIGVRGLATAAITGILSTNARWIIVMDADGQHDPAAIPEMIAPLADGSADIVSVSRNLADLDDTTLTAGRRRLSRASNGFAGFFLNRQIEDAMSGFFAVTCEAFESTVRHLSDAGFKLLLDILHSNPELRHVEIQHAFRERRQGDSKLDLSVAWQFLCFVIAKSIKDIIPARLISFLLVGMTGIVVHFIVLLPVFAVTGHFSASQLAAAVIAATWNYWLNNGLTFPDRRLRGASFLAGLIKYQLVASVGIFANVAVASAVFSSLNGFVIVSALAGVLVDTIWKYFVSSLLVWRQA